MKNFFAKKTVFFLIVIFIFSICFLSTSLTIYATESNCGETDKGSPDPNMKSGCGTGSDVGDYAKKLKSAIQEACKAHPASLPNASYVMVTGGSGGTKACLDAIPLSALTPNDQATFDSVKGELTRSADLAFPEMPNCNLNLQCVGFTLAVARGSGTPLETANAGDFAGDREGYKWYSRNSGTLMKNGDIPVWNTHIAVTIEVINEEDPDSPFTVAESNGCSTPGISDRGSVGEQTYPNQKQFQFCDPSIDPDCVFEYLGFLRKL